MKASVFCDVVDPWSYLGATRFERAAAMFTILTGEVVEIAYRAARIDSPVDEDRVIAAARISGIELDLDDRVPADSTDAWRLLTWAAESGEVVQRDLLHQLWRAHLLEGADVADAMVLSSRAALAGLPLGTAEALLASTDYAADVDRQRATAREIGAHELPFIVVEADRTLSGLLSQDDYLQAIHQIHRDPR